MPPTEDCTRAQEVPRCKGPFREMWDARREAGVGLLTDRELWACAVEVEKQHGERAPYFITERILALAEQGDQAGVATWKAISDRYDQLRTRPVVRVV